MRSLVTFGFAALGLTALLGCGETAAPADNTFTEAQRAEIEAEIEQLMTELYWGGAALPRLSGLPLDAPS